MLIQEAEKEAKKNKFTVITLEVRETQKEQFKYIIKLVLRKVEKTPNQF